MFLPILMFSVSAAFCFLAVTESQHDQMIVSNEMWEMSDELWVLWQHKFRRRSKLTAHYSKPTGRREARRANSRGFLTPWKNWQDKKWRLKDAERQPSPPIRVFTDSKIVRAWGTEGLKAPGYSCSRLSDVFAHRSSFTAHHSPFSSPQKQAIRK